MTTLTTVDLPQLFYVFQLTKSITFDVSYYRLGNNTNQHFSTSANVFNRPKTDYNRCGQCQEEVLFGKAKAFYKKWDSYHLKPLKQEQYNEMLNDIEVLKQQYNFVYRTDRDISFEDSKQLSKLQPKTK
jgi:hypothetical protein